MLIVVYDVNILLIVLTTQRDGFDKKKFIGFLPSIGFGNIHPLCYRVLNIENNNLLLLHVAYKTQIFLMSC